MAGRRAAAAVARLAPEPALSRSKGFVQQFAALAASAVGRYGGRAEVVGQQEVGCASHLHSDEKVSGEVVLAIFDRVPHRFFLVMPAHVGQRGATEGGFHLIAIADT